MKTKREVVQMLLNLPKYNLVDDINELKIYIPIYNTIFNVNITLEEIEKLLILQ